MFRGFASLFLIFIPLFWLSSQPLLINVENSPSTFKQTNPKIWKLNEQEFLVIWDDYRQGVQQPYGQFLKSDLRFLGKNRPLQSNGNLFLLNDSTFLLFDQIEKEIDFGGFYVYDVNFLGTVYQNHLPCSDTRVLFGFTADACGMGGTSFYLTILPFKKYFLKIISSNYFSIDYYDPFLNPLRTIQYLDKIPIIVNPVGQGFKTTYWLAGLNEFWTSDPPDSLKLNLFLFDERDSLVKQETLENFGPGDEVGEYYSILDFSILRTLKLNDSTALIGYWLPGTQTIYLFTLDDLGRGVNRQSIKIQSDDEIFSRDFSLKKGSDGSVLAHLSWNTYSNSKATAWNYFLYWDSSGHFSGDAFKTSALFKPLKSTDFVYLKKDAFLAVKNLNDEIYLCQIEGDEEIQSLKINDDATGSNEDVSGIVAENRKNYLVIYHDEKELLGRKVQDNKLTSEQPEIPLQGSKGAFFKNGYFLNFWVWGRSIGYALFDKRFRILKSDTLCSTPLYAVNSINGFVKSDSTFIVAYTVNRDLYLREIRTDGFVLNSFNGKSAYEDDLRIVRSGEREFWVCTSVSAQKFSYELQPLTEKIDFSSVLYLVSSQSHFLIKDHLTLLQKGMILTERDTVAVAEELAPYKHPFQCLNIDEQHFVSIFIQNSQFKFKLFDWRGHFLHEKTAPIDSVYLSNVKHFQCAIHDSLLYLAWSNTNGDSTGYNVYAYTMPVDVITSTSASPFEPRTTVLVKSYPNPFNHVTTIKIALPGKGQTSVTIFNLLGERVKTLLKNAYREGVFELRWDGTNETGHPVSSGLYFCRVQYKNRLVHRKLMFLK